MYEIIKIKRKGDMVIRSSAVKGLIKLTANDNADEQQSVFALTVEEAIQIASALLMVVIEIQEA